MPPLHARGMVSQCTLLFYWEKFFIPQSVYAHRECCGWLGGQFHLEVAGLKLEAAVLLFGCV